MSQAPTTSAVDLSYYADPIRQAEQPPELMPKRADTPFFDAYRGGGFFGGASQFVGDVYNTAQIAPGAYRGLDRAFAPTDPNFAWTPDSFQKYINSYNIPREITRDLWEARSIEHANIIRDQALDLQERYQRINTAGYAGTTMSIAASLADPVNLAVMALPGVGEGRLAMMLTQTGRLGRAAELGLIEATDVGLIANTLGRSSLTAGESLANAGLQFGLNAGAEQIRVANDPFANESDVMTAGLNAAVLGGIAPRMGQVSRLTRFGTIGTASASTTFASEYVIGDKPARDALTAAALAGILGGTLSALPAARANAIEVLKQSMAMDLVESKLPLSAKGQKFVNEAMVFNEPMWAKDAEMAAAVKDAIPYTEGPDPYVQPGPKTLANDAEVDLGVQIFSIGQMSRRQAGQMDIPGFVKGSGKQYDARLNSDGIVELGDRFFSLSKSERETAIQDALRGGLLDGEGAKIDIQGIRERLKGVGNITPETVWQSVPNATAETAAGIAERLRALDRFDAIRNGRTPAANAPFIEVGLVKLDKSLPAIEKAMKTIEASGKRATPIAIRKVIEKTDYTFNKLVNNDSIESAIRKIKIRRGEEVAPLVGTPINIEQRPVQFKPSPEIVAQAKKIADDAKLPSPADNPAIERNPVVSVESRGTGPVNDGSGSVASATKPAGDSVATPPPPPQVGDFDPSGHDSTPSMWSDKWYAFVRLPSSAAQLGRSKNPLIVKLSNMLLEDALPKLNGKYSPETMERWVNRNHVTTVAKFARNTHENFDKWFTDKQAEGLYGPSIISRQQALTDFASEAGMAVRRVGGNVHPAIKAQVEAYRKSVKELKELGERHGIAGFDKFDTADNYLTRVYSLPKIDDAINTYGVSRVHDVLEGAMRKGMPNMDQEYARTMARGVLDRIRSSKIGMEIIDGRVSMDQNVRGIFAEILRGEGITDEGRINKILGVLEKPGEPSFDRAKSRIQLDETHRIEADKGGSGGDGSKGSLGMEDILENDIVKLHDAYSRQVYGQAAEAKMLQQFPDSEGNTPKSFGALKEQLMLQVSKDMSDGKITSDDAARQVKEIEKLETYLALVKGIDPSRLDDRLKEAMQALRLTSHLAKFGQAGIGNIADAAYMMAPANWESMYQQFPAVKNIISTFISGKPTDDLVREVEALGGLGTDRMVHRVNPRHDGSLAAQESNVGRFNGFMRNRIQNQSDISGLSSVAISTQRIVGVIGMQKFASMALKAETFTDAHLASLSMNRDMAKRIASQIKQFSKLENGTTLRRLSIGEWKDAEAAAAFTTGWDRYTRRTVQQNDLGNMSLWMTNQVGRTLIQFKSFPIVAQEKQLYYAIATGNKEAIQTFFPSMAIAALAYVARQYINQVPGEDGQKFLQERLAWSEIAKASFARAQYSGLIPPIVDTVALFGGTPLFGNARSTMASADFTSFPAMEIIQNSSAIARAPFNFLTGQGTQQDARALRIVAPFQNTSPLSQGLNWIQSRLPKTNTEAP